MQQLLKEQEFLDYLHEKGDLTERSTAVKKLGLSFLMSHTNDHFLDGIEPFPSKLFPYGHDLYYSATNSAEETPNEQAVLAVFNTSMTDNRVATITIQVNDPYTESFKELAFQMKLINHTNGRENMLLEKVGDQYFSDFPSIDTDFALRDVLFST